MTTNDQASAQIPFDAIIPMAKLTRYLLVEQDRDDKSKFLAQAGFNLENYKALDQALRILAISTKAVEDRTNNYGTFYQAIGRLEGINGTHLNIVTVWLRRRIDNKFQFVTLMPHK
ncbi:MAG: DUF6883 domain-containing protein [Cyanobacteria bacterium J06629_19]